jgi:hypothetical protein
VKLFSTLQGKGHFIDEMNGIFGLLFMMLTKMSIL